MEWQPIESAPKDGTVVDLWVDGGREADCRWRGGAWVTVEDGCVWSVASDPTHWMPLPQPPRLSSDAALLTPTV